MFRLLAAASFALLSLVLGQDPTCTNGVLAGGACCKAECGSCGGPDCGPRGQPIGTSCCIGFIKNGYRFCSEVDAPCKIGSPPAVTPPPVEETPMPSPVTELPSPSPSVAPMEAETPGPELPRVCTVERSTSTARCFCFLLGKKRITLTEPRFFRRICRRKLLFRGGDDPTRADCRAISFRRADLKKVIRRVNRLVRRCLDIEDKVKAVLVVEMSPDETPEQTPVEGVVDL